MKTRPGTQFYATGQEAEALFQNLGQAIRQGSHNKIRKIQNELDVISKRQRAQLKNNVPLENLS